MRKFLGTIVLVAILVGGIGVYRGWFDISSDNESGETNVELRIDKERIKHDAEAATEKARQFGRQEMGPDVGGGQPGARTPTAN